VKSTTDHHREALDQALRQALSTSQPALRKQALARAAQHLIHPRLILDSPLLTESHVWHREALVVSDAFEAVTNGMEEPGVLEALEALEPDSPFQAWRHLVLAIHFFHEGLDEAVAAHVAQLPSDSPTERLGRCLSAAIRGTNEGLSASQRRLTELLAQPDPALIQSVQDVAEGLETDDEGLFWSALADWLEAVAVVDPTRARSAILWAWNQLEWREFDEAVLLDLSTSLWGAAESYRLAALGTLSWDAEGAALLWLRFLLTLVRDGANQAEVADGRALLDRFGAAAEAASEPSPEARETWHNLCGAWNAEMRVRGWSKLEIADRQPTATPSPAPIATNGQLDLFA
jgi:hypothetical protein